MALEGGTEADLAPGWNSITAKKPPVLIACPTIACAFCGIPSVTVAPATVEKLGYGGVESEVWRPVDAPEEALGDRIRPHPLRGHLCPPCSEAIDRVGSVGFTSRSRAVLAVVERSSKERASRLRLLLTADDPPTLPAWRVMASPRVPNETPWAHLRLDRL